MCWLLRFVLQSYLSEVWSLAVPRQHVGILPAHAGTRPRACLQLRARVSQRESRGGARASLLRRVWEAIGQTLTE
eukprot:3406922-Amphidinium_carterae.1